MTIFVLWANYIIY